MDLYLVDPGSDREKGPAEIRLTNARGYDAEASFSPDGQLIVFSSNRSAYDHELSKEDRERLEIDPAYFADLYVMKADGSGLRRLTNVPGYDGGPFFFPDGKRIIWRRFTEDGLKADVWSMKPDGSDAKKLTDFGAMSWAPYVHPSGQYVLFASNKLGFSNFEIFMVDIDGSKEPVRVTYTDGFDGLPVPTPDGKELVFTSSRGGGPGAQLYIAQWNHEQALEALANAPARIPAGGSR
jgi:Tol biopolymer transport system component